MELKKLEESKLIKVAALKRKFIIVAVISCVLIVGGIIISLLMDHIFFDSKTTKIGFEDIGELDTQVAYCTVVDVIDDPRKIFGVEVPFAKSKYIYSYDVVVKAGMDFGDIEWKYKENSDKINVVMPELYVTDSYIDEESGKIYLEDESIFSPITLEEQMEARANLVKKGVDDAIDNGLYDRAKENAEKIMTSFFKQYDEYKDKEIVFKWEE